MIAIWPLTLFYSLEVLPDFRNATLNRLNVIPTKTIVSPEFFLSQRFSRQLKSIENYATSVLRVLVEDDVKGQFFRASEIPRRVASLMEVSRKIAEIEQQMSQSSNDSTQASIYNMKTVSKLQQLAPSVNWTSFILSVLPPDVQIKISLENMMINILDVRSIEKVERLISGLNSTLLLDYMEWRVVLSQVNNLDERFLSIWKNYQEEALGIKAQQPQWIFCQETTLLMFPEMANYFYINEYFSNENYNQLKQMIENIRQSFKKLIYESLWLDEATKSKSLLKLNSILSWNFVNMMHAVKRWNYDHEFKQLVEANIRESFNFPPPESNAFYIPTRNQIGQDTKAALNYGGIGIVIGHEITHAFDNEGSRYDELGNMNNWWDNRTRASFRQLQECFIKQYSEIEVYNTNGMKIDGKRTLTENIADNGGIRAAYKAMERAIQNNTSKQVKIRGLEEYEADQLFFINFAYTWCSNTRQEAAPVLLVDDDHSPSRERVNTALKNQEEYLQAFNCHNPNTQQEQQCRLW
uniref:Peptidase M13 C-terminal domain-containing protein n=1 Tax=Syphacia muris TaxID=451379 RepID=A0A0N5AJI4_9BILA